MTPMEHAQRRRRVIMTRWTVDASRSAPNENNRPIPEVQQVNLPALKRSFATSGSLSGRIKNFGGAHVWYPEWNLALACTATGSGHSRDDSGLRCAACRQFFETFGHRKERLTPSAHVENNRAGYQSRRRPPCGRWRVGIFGLGGGGRAQNSLRHGRVSRYGPEEREGFAYRASRHRRRRVVAQP